jgi:N-acetylmuramoyl-L-alanine amidase
MLTPAPLRSGAAIAALLVLGSLCLPVPARAQSAATLYERAQARETAARRPAAPAADALRTAARTYENIVRRHPTSGYCDNALWQAAGLMITAYEVTGSAADRDRAEHYLDWLRNEYPHSSLVREIAGRRRALAPAPARPAPGTTTASETASGGAALLRKVTRTALPRGDRIVIELSREVAYRGDRVENPDRVYFDFASSTPAAALVDRVESLSGRLVDQMRIGRHEGRVTRVVLELKGNPRYSVFPLYEPFRLVIDLESDSIVPLPVETVPAGTEAVVAAVAPSGPPPPTPVPPAATRKGDYSLARQLGLGVARIVIDAGHGGHDPGAQANGITEAELTLDVARRVEQILKDRPGFEVVLTRSSNQYIPLEERTAIANLQGDLFLSIHANASRRTATRGVETYVLNFATNPEAEAVAARENATSAQTMSTLPAILKAIVANNKMDESRELATIVQTNLVRKLRARDAAVRDLGVKQAPFVVLIGAQIPSVLAEISFITNKADATLLKQDSYRQRIAEALAEAIVKYQGSLKKVTTLAGER